MQINIRNENVYQDVFIDNSSVTQARFIHVVKGIQSDTATRQSQTFHVASLSTAQGHYSLFGQHIQGKRIDSLCIQRLNSSS